MLTERDSRSNDEQWQVPGAVSTPRRYSRPRLRMTRGLVVALWGLWAFPAGIHAQSAFDVSPLARFQIWAPSQDPAPSRISPFQVGSILVGGGIGITAAILGQDVDPPTCVPCDPAHLPAIDRWSVRTERPSWGRASDVVVLGLAGGIWIDLGRREGGFPHLLTSIEAFGWTFATTQILKNATDRLRPVLYTADAADAADKTENQRSFPSGHASTAFSLATSYFLSHKKLTGESRWWIFVPAVFVGVARVAAAKHFTTDVLAGAAIGTVTSLVVYEIRF